jgi:hypothetical protein
VTKRMRMCMERRARATLPQHHTLMACISETFHKIRYLHTRNYFDHMVRVEHVKVKHMDDMH